MSNDIVRGVARKVEADAKRRSAVEEARERIEKKYGKGAILQMKDGVIEVVSALSTGSIQLDRALGVWGYPRGRIVEIFGVESSGKTTLALHAVAEAQKQGGIAAFVDAEHGLDPVYAKALGVDVDEMWLSQPDDGEQALNIVQELVESGGVDIVVVDSVAALTPRAEIEGDMGDSHMGLHARLMSQALRKLNGVVSRQNAVLLMVNQIRMKLNQVWGNPEVTPGGRALKFYSTVRLEVRKIETVRTGDTATGILSRVKVVKNKVAAPFKSVELDIVFGKGIDREKGIVDCAAESGVIKRSRTWYSLDGKQLGQGVRNVADHLREHPEVADDLERRIREADQSD